MGRYVDVRASPSAHDAGTRVMAGPFLAHVLLLPCSSALWARDPVSSAATLILKVRRRARLVRVRWGLGREEWSPQPPGTPPHLPVRQGLLRECTSVDVDVTGLDVLRGAVGGVSVSGKNWCSYRNLRCRSLAFRVGPTEVDMPSLLATASINFRETTAGTADVVFDAEDFVAFLRHPYVGPEVRLSDGDRLYFSPSGAHIRPGGVTFRGAWRGRDLRLFLAPDSTDIVSLTIDGGGEDEEDEGEAVSSVCRQVGAWFRQLRVDLDGALVGPIQEMAIIRAPETGRGGSSLCLRLGMGLNVAKFPSLPPKF